MGNPEETAPPPQPPEGDRHTSGAQSRNPELQSAESIWARIKRHKVVEWTLAYVAFAYAVLHGVQMLRETFEWPLLVPRVTVVLLLVGVPTAATLAWYHGHRTQHRVSGIEISILIGLFFVAGSVLWWASRSGSTHAHESLIISSPTLGAKSVAVLPFVDLSEKHDQEYFGDGIAEEVLDLLAKIPGLTVAGRTSSFQFKGRASDLRKIGAELGVSYLVEGSVRKSGDRVKVTAQLIDARGGAHRWSETYERQAADALSLQTQIAAAIARELEISVTDLFSVPGTTKSPEAYDFYLHGIRDVDTFTPETQTRAISEFSRAVELDPNYINAWIGLADAYDSTATGGEVRSRAESYRLAREAADRALALDPKNADAYAMRAFIRMNTWDWSGAEGDVRQSLSVGRTSGASQAAAKLAMARGDLVTAETLLRATLATDPLDTYGLSVLATDVYPGLNRFEESDRLIARLIDRDPEGAYLNYQLAMNALYEGRAGRALEYAKHETDSDFRDQALAVIYSAMGNAAESENALQRLLHSQNERLFHIACVYAYRTERDLAFEYLNRAYDARSVDLLYLKTEPRLAKLRVDPRYKALLHKMNLPE